MNQPTNIELRQVLFDTLTALTDKKNPMDIDRALAIKEISQVVVNTAKVEIDYLKINAGIGSGFITGIPDAKLLPPGDYVEKTGSGTKTVTRQPDGTIVTRHRMDA